MLELVVEEELLKCVVCDYGDFFFFQAEDGIRDVAVTGVQTCALPIVAVTNSFGKDTSAPATLTVWVPFPGIYNTGLGVNRAALDDGQIDPHYKLVVNPDSPASSDSVVQDSTLYPIADGP